MNTGEWVAFGGVLIAALVQIGSFLYWGGEVRQMLRDHDRRIGVLEKTTERRRAPRDTDA